MGHDDEQRGLLVAQCVELQLVIGGQIAQLPNVKGRARRAPQEIKMLLTVFPATACQGLFSIPSKK
jgi:hypothetical protein